MCTMTDYGIRTHFGIDMLYGSEWYVVPPREPAYGNVWRGDIYLRASKPVDLCTLREKYGVAYKINVKRR